MDLKLVFDAIRKAVAGVVAVIILVFLPAGTVHYWNAWLFAAILFIPMIIMGIVLYLKAPELLRKRLNERESESEQKRVVAWSALMFIAGFVLAGFDFRFGWSHLPRWAVYVAAVVFLLGYAMYAEVMRENAYLSRTIEVQENQQVVDTGLYGIVRHPMYTSTLLMFLATPFVLGSAVSFIVFLVYPILIAKRIRNEEAILEQGLEGYGDYKQRVKYRMIPRIW